MDTVSLNLILKLEYLLSAPLNTKGTRALDKLQTTRVTKELREFSDKPDVSVDSNSHSFGLTTLNHVSSCLSFNEETKHSL